MKKIDGRLGPRGESLSPLGEFLAARGMSLTEFARILERHRGWPVGMPQLSRWASGKSKPVGSVRASIAAATHGAVSVGDWE